MKDAADDLDPSIQPFTPEMEEAAIRLSVTRIIWVLGPDVGHGYFEDLFWEDGRPVRPTKRQRALYREALCRRMTALLRHACPQADIAVLIEPTDEYPTSEIEYAAFWVQEEDVWLAIFANDEDAWDDVHAKAFDDALAVAPRARRTRPGSSPGGT